MDDNVYKDVKKKREGRREKKRRGNGEVIAHVRATNTPPRQESCHAYATINTPLECGGCQLVPGALVA